MRPGLALFATLAMATACNYSATVRAGGGVTSVAGESGGAGGAAVGFGPKPLRALLTYAHDDFDTMGLGVEAANPSILGSSAGARLGVGLGAEVGGDGDKGGRVGLTGGLMYGILKANQSASTRNISWATKHNQTYVVGLGLQGDLGYRFASGDNGAIFAGWLMLEFHYENEWDLGKKLGL